MAYVSPYQPSSFSPPPLDTSRNHLNKRSSIYRNDTEIPYLVRVICHGTSGIALILSCLLSLPTRAETEVFGVVILPLPELLMRHYNRLPITVALCHLPPEAERRIQRVHLRDHLMEPERVKRFRQQQRKRLPAVAFPHARWIEHQRHFSY